MSKRRIKSHDHEWQLPPSSTDDTPEKAHERNGNTKLQQTLNLQGNQTLGLSKAEYQIPNDYITKDGKIDKKRKFNALNVKGDRGRQVKDRQVKDRQSRDEWENYQFQKAQSLVNTNIDEITIDSTQYEYVFDESQFIQFDSSGNTNSNSLDEVPVESNKPSIVEGRKLLPVYRYRQQFLELVKQHQILVVVGETGSGKTTQLPQYLYEEGYCTQGMVGCTQPRRVAATSVATRVAVEMECKLGQEVGYSIRFDDKSSRNTKLKYLTDGTLLREFLTDRTLSKYSALIIDEAHERTISTEIILSLLKTVCQRRSDLRLIIASATINADKFATYFNGAPIFNIPGRTYPVDIHYTKQPEANYIQAVINTVFLIHTKKPKGDILVFLTGQDEIETTQQSLLDALEKLTTSVPKLFICPIYANLPNDLQRHIFEPSQYRKVVLATNIAETSITIPGVKYVIDLGYVKENVYNASTGMDSLVVVPCSKASADQRAGRAGRLGPGECFRLYTKWSFDNELATNPVPEILRGNLLATVLLLLSLGITDLVNFDFMDAPDPQTLIKCLSLLYAIGALDSKGQLTSTGRTMSQFPIDPMFCKCLITSTQLDVLQDIIVVISMLGESSNLFYRPKDKKEDADKKRASFNDAMGDHLMFLNIWHQWKNTGYSNVWCEEYFIQYKTLKRVRDVIDQLEKLCAKFLHSAVVNKETTSDKLTRIQKSIVAGFFPHIVRLAKTGESYRLIKKNQSVYIHPSSSLFPLRPPPKLILYHELVLTSKEYMRNCMIVKGEWLEMANHYFTPHEMDFATVKS